MSHLRMKMTLRAHNQKVVFIKGSQENPEHTYMKIFLWALYLPTYPNCKVEMRIDDRYKPDVVELDEHGQPRFWAEAGQVGRDKIFSLVRRYKQTHFVIAKWDKKLDPWAEIVTKALEDIPRTAPVDLHSFHPDSAEKFIDSAGNVNITFADVTSLRLGDFPDPDIPNT